MYHDTLVRELAAQRDREVARGAVQRRLAALARCCRPAGIARLVRRLRDLYTARPQATACCA